MATGLTELFELVGLGMPFVYAVGAYTICHHLDTKLSAAAKKALAARLKPQNIELPELGDTMVELFDRLYTSPLWGWRAMLRSALITTLVMAVFIFAFLPEYLPWLIGDIPNNSGRYRFLYLTYLPIILLTVIASDYISLYIVRAGLVWAKGNGWIGFFLAPLLGILVVSALIYVRTVAQTKYASPNTPILEIFNLVNVNPFWFQLNWPALAVHLWLPLLAFAIGSIRVYNGFVTAVVNVQWSIKQGSQHQLDAIGYVVGGIIFVVTALGHWVLPR